MRVIDADLHNGPPTLDQLRPYLDARWHGHVELARDTSYAADTPAVSTVDAVDLGGAEFGILCCG